MDFKDIIRQLGERVSRLKEQTLTEEATKHAFVLPFLQALGYDVFNPSEIVPEYIADVGLKKGEKVDFAVLRDGAPVILVETKHWKQKLDNHDGQLLRYFHTCKAKFAVLTNGVEYRFFTDLVEANKMDQLPFLEFDITKITDAQCEELKKFHKSYFDVANIVSSASELKYTAALRALLVAEFKNPTEAFVRFFTKQVYSGMVTDKVVFQFSDLLRRSMHTMLSDMITERLNSAAKLEQEGPASEPVTTVTAAPAATVEDKSVETTPEELEAFYIIKAMLRKHVDPSRITLRDAQSYCAILFDDNNRKPIARLYFNSSKKYVSTFDSARAEQKNLISSLDDILQFEDQMKFTVETYLGLSNE